MEYKDYYRTLGVARTASADEIRKAFRKLAREYHPDVARNKASAEEKFKEINEAYEVLGDAEKRRKYDTFGSASGGAGAGGQGGFRAPPGWQQPGGEFRFPGGGGTRAEFRFGGTGFSDFFESLFGQAARGQSPFGEAGFEEAGPGGRRQRRGQDVEGAILVTLQEALRGSVRSISLQSQDTETGERTTQTLKVRIPAGVREGKMIRIPGKGQPGAQGAEAGDLYLQVKFAKHPDFAVEGSHLYYELALAPWEAVLGATVTVPTLEGTVSLRIPPGTSNGRQLRVRGRGLPDGEAQRGDLFVNVIIDVPEKVDAKEQALWEELARSSRFNPRPH